MASTTELKLVISAQNKASKELNKLRGDFNKFANTAQASNKKATTGANAFGSSLRSVGTAMLALGAYIGTTKVLEFAKNSMFAAARAEELGFALNAVGKSSGYGSEQINNAVEGLRENNIAMLKAKEITLLFMQSSLDLTDAIKLSNVAKDLAVIGSTDSSEATVKLTQAIATQQVELMRGFGITTTSDKIFEEYGATIGKTSDEMTEAEKKQAFLNKILKEGEKVTGAYDAAMESSGKQYRSLVGREIPDMMAALGEGLLPVLSEVTTGTSKGVSELTKYLKDNRVQVVYWGTLVVQSLKLAGIAIFNAITIIGRVITYPIVQAIATVEDAIGRFKQLARGDFTGAFSDGMRAVRTTSEELKEGISKDIGDIQNAMFDGTMSMNNSIDSATSSAVEFEAGVKDSTEAVEELSKEAIKAGDKIEDLKDKLHDAMEQGKEDIKDFEDDFKKTEKQEEEDFARDIAGILVDKQDELLSLQKDYADETEKDSRKSLRAQMREIQSFLAKHKNDLQQKSREMQDIRKFNALDEIDQLKFTFAEEKEVRKEAYEEELDNLEDHLDDIKDEYEDKIKDIKDELRDLRDEQSATFGGGDFSYDDRPKGTSKREWDKMHGRAFGGAVGANEAILVGERKPEVFIPSQSGNIKQTANMGGATINFNNVSISNEADENRLVDKIRQVLDRETSLGMLGVR